MKKLFMASQPFKICPSCSDAAIDFYLIRDVAENVNLKEILEQGLCTNCIIKVINDEFLLSKRFVMVDDVKHDTLIAEKFFDLPEVEPVSHDSNCIKHKVEILHDKETIESELEREISNDEFEEIAAEITFFQNNRLSAFYNQDLENAIEEYEFNKENQ